MNILVTEKIYNINDLFTAEDILSLYADHVPTLIGLNLLKKILLLSNEFIFTKAIMSNHILSRNSDLKDSNSKIINQVNKMQEIARDKIITVINKFYKVDFHNAEDPFEIVLLLYIWAMQWRGIEIEEDGCLYLWSAEKIEGNAYMKLNPSYMDDIVRLCNEDNEDDLITSILEYEDPLYDILVELVGEKEVLKSL